MTAHQTILAVYIIATLSVCGNASLDANRVDGSIMSIVALTWILIELIVRWRKISDGKKD